VGEARYTPYGEMRRDYPRGVIPTDRLYTGQRQETFGLYDYRARYYDPALGRFVSADTVVPEAGNPQALNQYAYVTNNPLRYTDPSGHYIFEGEYCVGPGCDYNPTSPCYQLPLMGGTINPNTYFLSPAVSQEIFGVAEAQRVAVGTVVAVNDPNNVGMRVVALAAGLAGWAAGLPIPQAGAQPGVPLSLGLDALGDPDCPGCGFHIPWNTEAVGGMAARTPNAIGRWGEQMVGEHLPVEIGQFRVARGQRVYDGRFIGTEDAYVETKTSTRGVVALNPDIRAQVAFDVDMSPKPTWILVNARPSRGFLNLLREQGIPWHQLHVPR
jgi:RHS repeat-associated protein